MSDGTWVSRTGAVADAVGQCVLVFAFLPALASLPPWLAFEARNALNVEDPVVLTFLPVRGAILLLHAFRAGVLPGVLTGVVDGLLLCGWVYWRGVPRRAGRRLALGALGGLIAAGVVTVTMIVFARGRGRMPEIAVATLAFELGAGLVCGMVAVSTAARLAAGIAAPSHPAS